MNLHAKIAMVILALGALAITAAKFAWPYWQENIQRTTSDARDTKGRITIGVDNWVGYFPLCSAEMKKRIRATGYVVVCVDDKADYPSRMEKLRDGGFQFAVATIDAYLLNGASKGFPGTVVAVIDESKGGDAIVAWSDKVANLDALKRLSTVKVAYTSGSPSEHLLRATGVHFDVPALRQKGPGRVETQGSPEALKKLLARQVDLAVVWEPDVTRALSTPGVVKLLGTEDTRRLIVDVLLVSRTYSAQNAAAVETFLTTYFQVAKHYRENAQQLEQDVADAVKLPAETVKRMLAGVAWASLSDNYQTWLGTTGGADALADAIHSTARILIEAGEFKQSPLPDQDPYRIINRQFLGGVYVKAATGGQADAKGANSLERKFPELADGAWGALKDVGTLKVLPVVFQSGTAELSQEGKLELDRAMETLAHYPNFRIVIKGHTGVRGNAEENKRLSEERAESVARYLNVTYNVDRNRLRVLGFGGENPLPQQTGEGDRAYGYRLPRVELSLVSEAL
jgi:outer membrane protein OmpA-like peptidoglycan-associated protein/ABC-type nitrate/sulfonate/bicarbonate transport system substrate-binding protein